MAPTAKAEEDEYADMADFECGIDDLAADTMTLNINNTTTEPIIKTQCFNYFGVNCDL